MIVSWNRISDRPGMFLIPFGLLEQDGSRSPYLVRGFVTLPHYSPHKPRRHPGRPFNPIPGTPPPSCPRSRSGGEADASADRTRASIRLEIFLIVQSGSASAVRPRHSRSARTQRGNSRRVQWGCRVGPRSLYVDPTRKGRPDVRPHRETVDPDSSGAPSLVSICKSRAWRGRIRPSQCEGFVPRNSALATRGRQRSLPRLLLERNPPMQLLVGRKAKT